MVLTKPPPEHYTLISAAHHDTVFSDYQSIGSGKYVDLDAQLMASIRDHHPGMTVTVIPADYANLIGYANAGHAHAELDTSEDSLLRWRFYQPAEVRGGSGHLADAYSFARYKYSWRNVDFTVYTVQEGLITLNYILYPPDDDETLLSHSKMTDALLQAIGDVQFAVQKSILVYDGYWTGSKALYDEIQKASWDDVILEKKMKKTLTKTVAGFFDSENSYKDFGVPWKRGLIFYGPAGCGKTVSIKALMHTISVRQDPVVCLYVKALRTSSQIGNVFQKARQTAPCLLILEDIDTLVTDEMRSYFFNEVDGLGNNNGIMIIATTNHLDRLDGGLAKRPSRFDRKYNFPAPNREERMLYCNYWRKKLQYNQSVDFPEELSPAIADITQDFTFAYLKEAFVASLLALARSDEDEDEDEDKPDESDEKMTSLEGFQARQQESFFDLDSDIPYLPLWLEMQKQVKILREDMKIAKVESKKATSSKLPIAPHQRILPARTGPGSDAEDLANDTTPKRLIRMRTAFNEKTRKILPKAEKESPFQKVSSGERVERYTSQNGGH